MASANRPSYYQYEPLITPQSWQGEERRFSIRLTELLDELHRRQGQLASKLTSVENEVNKPKEPALTLGDIYPVGSIYLSVSAVSPQLLFGGTWEQITDTFLLAAGDTYKAGSKGGEASHKLKLSEMPSHNHAMEYSTDGRETWTSLSTGKDGNSASRDHYGGMSPTVTLFAEYVSRIGYTGGSTAHNNMPPYLTVYVWKRTA